MIVYAEGSDTVSKLRIVKHWRLDTCSNVFILERFWKLLWWSGWGQIAQAHGAMANKWIKQFNLVKTTEAEEEDREVYLPTCVNDGI